MNDVRIGDLVYIDTFLGLIPAKLIEINAATRTATLRITAKRRGYRFGETVRDSALNVIRRDSVYSRSGQYRIRNDFTIEGVHY